MEVKKTNMEFVRFTISKIFRGEIDLLRVEGGGVLVSISSCLLKFNRLVEFYSKSLFT